MKKILIALLVLVSITSCTKVVSKKDYDKSIHEEFVNRLELPKGSYDITNLEHGWCTFWLNGEKFLYKNAGRHTYAKACLTKINN